MFILVCKMLELAANFQSPRPHQVSGRAISNFFRREYYAIPYTMHVLYQFIGKAMINPFAKASDCGMDYVGMTAWLHPPDLF